MKRTAPFVNFSPLDRNPPKATSCSGTSCFVKFRLTQLSNHNWKT